MKSTLEVKDPDILQTCTMSQRSGLPVHMSTKPASTVDPAIQSLLAERCRRLDSDKRQKDVAEKAERAKQAQYAREAKEKLQQDKLERARVLEKIVADRATGKEQDEQRKAVATLEDRQIAAGALPSGDSLVLRWRPNAAQR
ncbi:hypothetical protein N7G274_009295 [Stereocaulon virgatum]|uniref:Uncharacterized protein n=1 Tax=Stereocaulon virgatum TaxID=373712 RepID=A0ABR3ZWU4_9LECA